MMTVDDSKVFSDLLNTILSTILFIEGGEGGKRIESLNYNKNLIHGERHQQQKKHRLLMLLLLLLLLMMLMMMMLMMLIMMMMLMMMMMMMMPIMPVGDVSL